METLREQRKELTEAVSMSYSPDDFPGSSLWLKTQQLQKQLDVFDKTHPEIIAEIKVEQKAKDAAITKEAGWI